MPESTESQVDPEAPDQQPLVGRFVHLAVVLGVITGCGMLGWAMVGGLFGSVLVALVVVVVATALWWGTSAPRDPERSRLARITVPGPTRLLLELALVVAAGIGIWIVWNRAAGETFLTIAALDFAVRYHRIALLLRSR